MNDKNRKAMFAKNQKPHVYEHYHKVNNKMIDDKSDSDAKKKYQQAMKKLANKNGKIDLNNGNVYDEFGKIRDIMETFESSMEIFGEKAMVKGLSLIHI